MGLRILLDDKFYLGTAVPLHRIEGDEQLKSIAVENFNLLTPPVAFKMKWLASGPGQHNFDRADANVAFAIENKMALRGSSLSWRLNVPDWVATLSNAEAEKALEQYVRETVSRYRGKVFAWDVASEFFDANGQLLKTVWTKKLGREFLPKIFRWAAESDPHAQLFYSDYAWQFKPKQQAFLELAETLQQEGIGPIGAAMQFHHNVQGLVRIWNLDDFLDRLKKMGTPVHFSEITLWCTGGIPWDLMGGLQAIAYRKLLELAFKYDVPVFCVWGLVDKYAWRRPQDKPFLFDRNYQPKLAYDAVLDALEMNISRWRPAAKSQTG